MTTLSKEYIDKLPKFSYRNLSTKYTRTNFEFKVNKSINKTKMIRPECARMLTMTAVKKTRG